MLNTILKYGVIAGVVVGAWMFATFLGFGGIPPLEYGMLIGYAGMLLALAAMFFGIRRHRDRERGGALGFWPAFGIGVGISLVASVIYVVSWEALQAFTGMDFAGEYSSALLEAERAKGSSAEALAKMAADFEGFKVQYADPMFRLPMTFMEIFPVGVLVSLIAAALLRRRSVSPAEPAAVR